MDRTAACRDELLVICSPRHPLAGASALTAQDLLPYPFITRDPGNGIHIIAAQYFEAAGVPLEEVEIAAELGSLNAVKELAAQGLGFAIASRAAIQRDIAEDRLVGIPLLPAMYTPLDVIYPKDKFRSRLIETFADFAVQALHKMAAS
jgi:DNA-binding transcriptional LysR family regulator